VPIFTSGPNGGFYFGIMSIIRISKSEDPFARVPKIMLSDARLSWKAKGILSYLLGKPDNWEVRTTDLVNHSPDGITVVYTALKELRKLGYAKFCVVRKDGKIRTQFWNIYDRSATPAGASSKPDLGFLSPENPSPENPSPENLSLSKKEGKEERGKTKKESTAAAPKAAQQSSFAYALKGINGSPVIKLSRAVLEYAKFSVRQEYHIHLKLGPDKIKYHKPGGQPGGWSRPTLLGWEGAYQQFIRTHPDFDQILAFYLKNYDYLRGKEKFAIPECRTFFKVLERFDWIQNCVLQDRKRREQDGIEESETDEIPESIQQMTPEEYQTWMKSNGPDAE
jgi:hypothetical protein